LEMLPLLVLLVFYKLKWAYYDIMYL
jgi:hypothetical protein